MKFGDWLPDQDEFNNPGLTKALNVVPGQTYKPLRGLTTYGNTLGGTALGGFAVKNDAGDTYNFSGTADKLYRMTASVWAEVGTGYTTASESRWVFKRFGSYVIATNRANPIQKFDISLDSAFSALAGSPPQAKHMAVVRDFLVLGSLDEGANKLRWSGLNDVEEWTPGVKESGSQIMAEGGEITGLVGGEFGLVFQADQITRMEYQGPPLNFAFDTLETGIGCVASGSLARHGNKIFFLAENGFYRHDGTQSHPIGAERVDKLFYAQLDSGYLHKISSAIDPINKLVIWSYAGTGNTGGMPNRMIIYNWVLDKWSEAEFDHEFIYASLSEGYTLEQLDAFGTLETLAASLDSRIWQGGSLILSAFNPAHTLSYFTGAVKPAIIETGESQITPGQKSLVTEVWPEIDGSVSVKVASRGNFQSAAVYSGGVNVNALGFAPFVDNNRYHKFRFEFSDWSRAHGFQLKATPAGAF